MKILFAIISMVFLGSIRFRIFIVFYKYLAFQFMIVLVDCIVSQLGSTFSAKETEIS